jgi:hypothetical protein
MLFRVTGNRVLNKQRRKLDRDVVRHHSVCRLPAFTLQHVERRSGNFIEGNVRSLSPARPSLHNNNRNQSGDRGGAAVAWLFRCWRHVKTAAVMESAAVSIRFLSLRDGTSTIKFCIEYSRFPCYSTGRFTVTPIYILAYAPFSNISPFLEDATLMKPQNHSKWESIWLQ